VAILAALATADAGDRAGAVAALLAVAEDAPERSEARLRAAELLRDDGKVDEAERALAGAAAPLPAPAPAAATKPAPVPAAAPGRVANPATAAAAAKGAADAQAVRVTDVDVQLAIARSLIDEKRGDAALAARRLDETLARSPTDTRLLIARAGVEERRGDWRRALTLAGKLLARDRRSVEALNFLGFVAADHGFELPQALKQLQAAAILNPGTGAIIDSLGWAYFRSGDLPRAALFLEQAGRLEPGDAEILEHLGDLYAKRQDRTQALQAYQKALTLGPSDRVARDLQQRIQTLQAKSAAGR
jgi:tetratricopeptide (TPR) repeat protein